MAPTLGDSKQRNRDDYRIRQTSTKKRCYDIDGNAILSTAKPQSLLKAA